MEQQRDALANRCAQLERELSKLTGDSEPKGDGEENESPTVPFESPAVL
ncbi:MAG: hypothetical protein JSS27_00955 [Planctomycetes bacterium]|nr:hypothetical protein [Planctomycetota bacterium]